MTALATGSSEDRPGAQEDRPDAQEDRPDEPTSSRHETPADPGCEIRLAAARRIGTGVDEDK